jgi:hypothetical protein
VRHSKIGRPTSGLGQKPALPRRSIAVRFALNKQTPDRTGSIRRYVPIGDLSRCSNVQLLDHLVGKREQLVGNRQAERFGSLQIDNEGELGRLFDREVCWG